MRALRYHPKATAEAFRSAEFYETRLAGLGAEFLDELDRTVMQVEHDPERQAADKSGIRSVRLTRFPFRIHYVVDPDRIRILAVAHSSRKPNYWRPRMEN
jgi:hypothetical protein